MENFIKKAKATVATVKSALSKVLGLFEANDRFVVIDKNAPKPRVPFIKLHEAGHGTMPHQSNLYKIMHDCEKTSNLRLLISSSVRPMSLLRKYFFKAKHFLRKRMPRASASRFR